MSMGGKKSKTAPTKPVGAAPVLQGVCAYVERF